MKIYHGGATQGPSDKFSQQPEFTARPAHWLHLLSLLLVLCSYATSSNLSAASILDATDSVFRFQSKMAQRGHVASQYALAYMHENGQGTDKNLSEATDWYRKAAQQGFAPAKDRLVYIEMLNNGYQPQQRQWLLKLKQNADNYNYKHQGESAFLLAQLYADGLAVNKSLSRALKYLHIARAASVIGSDSEIRRVEDELNALRENYGTSDREGSQSPQQTPRSSADNKAPAPVQKQLPRDKTASTKTNKTTAKQSNRSAASNPAKPVSARTAAQNKPAAKQKAVANTAAATRPQAATPPQAAPSAEQTRKTEQQEQDPHPMQIICSGWQRMSSACR